MKKLNLKFFDKIIVAILGVLGFSITLHSCLVAYGVPSADYEFKGTVTDKVNSKPIPNIRVIHLDRGDFAFTNAEGKYAFNYKDDLFDSFHLMVEDIDGEENGGDFESQEIKVEITRADQVKKGKENWDWGKYVKTVNIELEHKK